MNREWHLPRAASAACAAAFLITAVPAWAESCSRSRDIVLNGGADLPEPPQAYRDLYKTCMATTNMPNVKDAFVLLDGGIAVIPKVDTLAATAATLSQFCDAYPRSTLRFLSRKDLQRSRSVELIVKMSSTSATPCQKIKGTDH